MSAALGAAGGALSGAAAGASVGSAIPGVGSAIGAVAGGILGGLGGLFGSGVDEGAIQARRDAMLERARRAALGNDLELGQAKARAAASGIEMGVTGSGSMQTYLSTMAQEFRRQNEWNVTQANKAADISLDALTVNQFGDLSRGLFAFGAANNWFRSPAVTSPSIPSYTPGFGMPLWR